MKVVTFLLCATTALVKSISEDRNTATNAEPKSASQLIYSNGDLYETAAGKKSPNLLGEALQRTLILNTEQSTDEATSTPSQKAVSVKHSSSLTIETDSSTAMLNEPRVEPKLVTSAPASTPTARTPPERPIVAQIPEPDSVPTGTTPEPRDSDGFVAFISYAPYAPTNIPVSAPTFTPTARAPERRIVITVTLEPTSTPKPTSTPEPTSTPTAQVPIRPFFGRPTVKPLPVALPTLKPSLLPRKRPTRRPVYLPTRRPTTTKRLPTRRPTTTKRPSSAPTKRISPTKRPSSAPTKRISPTKRPTKKRANPTKQPSSEPTSVTKQNPL